MRKHNRFFFQSTLTAVILTGCSAGNSGGGNQSPGINIADNKNPDSLLIVDCLLPGNIRQFGVRLTTLTAGRPIKTSGAECAQLGGEFTPADKANQASALKVWLPAAEAGDPEAQTYVGEIYEKGMGAAPNLAQATSWYLKAANQGSPRAKTDLGYLNERSGNVQQAQTLYADASRLGPSYSTADQVAPPATATTTQAVPAITPREEIQRGKKALTDEKSKLSQKRADVETQKKKLPQQELKQKEAEVAVLEKRIQAAEKELKTMEQDVNTGKPLKRKQPAPITTAADAPTIEILEPPISALRSIGKPKVPLSESAGNPVTIRGRVSPAKDVEKLTVNGSKQSLDAKGNFSTSVQVDGGGTDVSIEATGSQGKSADFLFTLLPPKIDSSATASSAQSGEEETSAKGVNFGKYYAVVIGNESYQNFSPLSTSVSDAQDVASVLSSRYGFKTIVLANATRSKMLSALDSLRKKLTSNDNLLIYYAGHGELQGGAGYWLPVDAEKGNTKSWISNSQVANFVDAMQARHVLIVADSCYSGTMSQSSIPAVPSGSQRSRSWYEAVSKSKVRVVLSSGGVRPVLDSGGGKHSVFASAFLGALRSGGSVLEGRRLYKALKGNVSSAAGKAGISQTPLFAPIKYAGHVAGDFVFLKGGQVAFNGAPQPGNDPNRPVRQLLALLNEKMLLGLKPV